VTIQPLSLLFTGHMVDLPGRRVPRFPPEIVDAVQGEIWHSSVPFFLDLRTNSRRQRSLKMETA
jgi:hypothetical protein